MEIRWERPIGRNWVVFISVFKDISHSICTQLVGPYLQSALLKGEGVAFHREDSIPCCFCCCHRHNGALVIMWISSPRASVDCVSDIAGDPAISPRICPHKNWLRVRFGQLKSHRSKWTLEEPLRWKDFFKDSYKHENWRQKCQFKLELENQKANYLLMLGFCLAYYLGCNHIYIRTLVYFQ